MGALRDARGSKRRALSILPLAIFALSANAVADGSTFEFGGHGKLNVDAASYPDDSLFHDLFGNHSFDLQSDLRLKFKWRKERWTFDTAYQLVALHNDGLAISRNPAFGAIAALTGLTNDDRRLFDFTDVIDQSSQNAVLHRLDRLWIGYANEKAVVRFGRQALSWGNGFFYAPMDLVNPFNPAAVDTEYKMGDDMLYGQYLRDNGEDVQAAVVFRRDVLTGDVNANQATIALKYHGFSGVFEYDVLVAESYDDIVVGFGASRGVGGAQWSADIVVSDAQNGTFLQFVTNLSYSWNLAGKNMSGIVEYHYNEFGQRADRYDPASLAGNSDLLRRLDRGQSFALGRHYLAVNVLVELTPLWSVSPVLLANLNDPSALLQLTTTYSLADNISLLANVNVPLGGNGSEFGGIATGLPGRYLSTDLSVFAQIAWYF